MIIDAWPLYVAAVLVAAVSPGPNVLVVMLHSLRYGWRNAIWTVGGNLACLFLVACLAALGIGALLEAQPVLYAVLKTLGAAYLIWMGARILRSTFAGGEGDDVTASANDGFGDVRQADHAPPPFTLARQAFLVSASNPKSVIFLSAVFPQFLDRSDPLVPQFAAMFSTLLVIVLIVHGAYGIAAASLRRRIEHHRTKAWLSRITGGSFVALGAGVLVSR